MRWRSFALAVIGCCGLALLGVGFWIAGEPSLTADQKVSLQLFNLAYEQRAAVCRRNNLWPVPKSRVRFVTRGDRMQIAYDHYDTKRNPCSPRQAPGQIYDCCTVEPDSF